MAEREGRCFPFLFFCREKFGEVNKCVEVEGRADFNKKSKRMPAIITSRVRQRFPVRLSLYSLLACMLFLYIYCPVPLLLLSQFIFSLAPHLLQEQDRWCAFSLQAFHENCRHGNECICL
ncbi:hypothetical protein OIU79_014909 [Salix purpurea]|uniref:Transmembrane protein n=1 Tax=Salix purpurea TaxID=77065 RepID=A0A9Q0PBE3_SALPP|nr:hypothetical protein OIU79_014909 [Salix purpurea]